MRLNRFACLLFVLFVFRKLCIRLYFPDRSLVFLYFYVHRIYGVDTLFAKTTKRGTAIFASKADGPEKTLVYMQQ